MTMCAYSEDYLSMAQKVLGDMLDFAVNTCDFDIDQFFAMFLVSDVPGRKSDLSCWENRLRTGAGSDKGCRTCRHSTSG